MAGDLEFGIAQSDRQFQAYYGYAEWSDKGPQQDLRAVFSIHPESVTLVAADGTGINHIVDLVGKTVNIGNVGSGQRQNSIDAPTAVGINYQTDLTALSYKAAEAPALLQAGTIDAFFYTVGHPSGTIRTATSGARKVRFVTINGTGIDNLLATYPYYAKSLIPVSLYPGALNTTDVETFGVKATLVTSAKIQENVVYAVSKEVFENFDDFKDFHPAYQVLTKENMLEGLSAPIHPGAMQYYQEAGLK
jgi:TRAP transporter TAXI family solute receptor